MNLHDVEGLMFSDCSPNNDSQRHSSPFDSLKFKEKVAIIDIGFWVFLYCICKIFEYDPQAFTTRKCLGPFLWCEVQRDSCDGSKCYRSNGPYIVMYCALVRWYWGSLSQYDQCFISNLVVSLSRWRYSFILWIAWGQFFGISFWPSWKLVCKFVF
jgi:hypothetical protein